MNTYLYCTRAAIVLHRRSSVLIDIMYNHIHLHMAIYRFLLCSGLRLTAAHGVTGSAAS
jgi:hypothetical protein